MTICAKTADLFLSGKSVLIAVPSPDAAAYIDQLLWRQPEDSFIPHVVASKPCSEKVVIAVNPTQNLNQAQVLWNLLPGVSPLAQHMDLVFDLFDETDPAKAALSQQRQQGYGKSSKLKYKS